MSNTGQQCRGHWLQCPLLISHVGNFPFLSYTCLTAETYKRGKNKRLLVH